MDYLLIWLNYNFGTSPSEFLITFVCVGAFYFTLKTTLVDTEISYLAVKFSPEFRRTMFWVLILCCLSVISQGAIVDVKEEFARDVAGGIGYLIGAYIALVIFPILVTYFIRLFFPLFKWIHKKTQ